MKLIFGIFVATISILPVSVSADSQSAVVYVSATVVDSCSAIITEKQTYSPCDIFTSKSKRRRDMHVRMSDDYVPPIVKFYSKTQVRTVNF